MGAIKNNATGQFHEFPLNEEEWQLLKMLNVVLAYVVLKDQIIQQVLYIICYNRFDFTPEDHLVFEMDPQDETHTLKVQKVSDANKPPKMKKGGRKMTLQ